MFIPADRLDDAYSGIKRGAVASYAPVLVFVAPDADALCACKILLSLLKADFISYKVVPVAGYTDLARANDELVDGNEELRTIVMLNCGGLVNLTELLALEPETTVYLIDSHRPLHLANVFANDQIRVLDDGEIMEDMRDERAAFELMEYGDSDWDSDSDSSESDSGEDPPAKLTDSSTKGDVMDGDTQTGNTSMPAAGSSDGTLVDEEGGRPRKLRRTDGGSGWAGEAESSLDDITIHTGESQRRRRRQARRTISTYYSSGTYYGGSVAGILYALGTQIARASCDALWWAIIGLTDQFIFERIERERYLAQYAVFQDEVARICPVELSSDTPSSADSPSDPAANPDQTSIICEQDFRFMHYRHWSLYDSMFHSSYVASRLAVWREKGRNRLLNLLAKMGIPQQQYQQPHKHMNVDLRASLKTKINKTAPEYGLHELYFPSFVHTYGWEYKFSAADVVYALTALLECSPGIAASLGAHVDWMGRGPGAAITEEVNTSRSDGISGGNEALGVRFYTALDAMDNFKLLQSGVDLSMRLQRAVVRQGMSMIERQSVKTLKSFRLAVLRDGPDLQILCHPLTLSKLSLFLVDAMREYGKTNLPFVLAALDERKDRYLVAGVTGSARHGDVRRNKFGLAFQATAGRTGARVKHDSFETATLEIRKEDLSGFMEALQSEMRS